MGLAFRVRNAAEEGRMHTSPNRRALGVVIITAACVLRATAASSMPAPAKLAFMDPTPLKNTVVSSATISVRLDAACSVDTNTLAVSFNGNAIPASSFMPFSACSSGRMQSQTATVAQSLPNGTISSGPTSLDAGQSATYSGSTTGGDALSWNF